MAILTQAHQGLKFKDANAQIIGMTGAAELAVMTLSKDGWVAIGGAPLDRNILSLHKNDTNGIFVTHRNDTGFVLNRTYADFNNDGTTVEYQERIGVDGNIGSIGMFSNHALALRTNNTNRVYIKNGGNVGIGTTDPIMKLQVLGDIYANIGNVFIDSGRRLVWGNSAQFIEATNSTSMEFSGGSGSIDMTLLANGNLGIGTTGPGAKLQVYSTATRDIFISGNGTQAQNGWQAEHAFFTSAGQGVIVGKANANNDTNRLHILYNTSNGDAEYLGYDTNNANRVRLNTNGDSHLNGGNVGIGTTSPGSKLQVNGGIYATNYLNVSGVNTNFNLYNNGTTYLNGDTTVDSTFLVTNGNVGIGTTSPSSKLNISSASYNDHITLTRLSDELGISVSGGQLTFEGGVTPFNNNDTDLGRSDKHWREAFVYSLRSGGALQFKTNGNSERMRIDSAGNVGIGTTSPSAKLEILGTTAGETVFDIQGTQGQLFSITDNLTGSIFAVSDISGVPILDVNSSGLSTFDGNVSVTGQLAVTNGIEMTAGNFNAGDNERVRLGNSADLQIYHDGSNSFIQDSGTGSLKTVTSGFQLLNSTQSQFMMLADGGATSWIKLYYSGAERLATTNTGVTISGTISTETGSTFAGAIKITETGTAQHILIGNQDSGGTNRPSMIQGVNGQLKFGFGSSWSAEGGTMTDTLVLDENNNATFAGIVNIVGTNSTNQESVLLRGISSDGSDLLGSIRTANTGGYNQEMRFYTSNANGTSDEDLTLTLKPDQSATFAGHVSMSSGNATGKFAVKSTGVHASYDFYNNGTSYFNSTVNVDGAFAQSGGDTSTFSGDVTVAGTLTAQEFHTEFISSSILHESGSTVFGNSSDDTHEFTGSVNVDGALDIKGSYVVSKKTVALSTSFANVLTINTNNHTGCYVKINVFGDWGGHSTVAYLGEFFIKNGGGGYGEPGMIIRQSDNTHEGYVTARIVDPAGSSGARDISIELQLVSQNQYGGAMTGHMTYTVEGIFNSVS